MHDPSQHHWKAVKRVLRYLKGTINLGLCLRRSIEFHLVMYTDADWAGDVNDRVSTTGYLLYLGHNPISWSSKKQSKVARSSTEAEFRAVATALAETTWVKYLLVELHIPLRKVPTIYCDNIGATYLCENTTMQSRMKHIAVDFHFVHNQVQRKTIRVLHIHKADQLADTLTKALPKQAFHRNLFKLGIVRLRQTLT